jgi:hypothetical protein
MGTSMLPVIEIKLKSPIHDIAERDQKTQEKRKRRVLSLFFSGDEELEIPLPRFTVTYKPPHKPFTSANLLFHTTHHKN